MYEHRSKLLGHETIISGHSGRLVPNTMALEMLEGPYHAGRAFPPWSARPRLPKPPTRLLQPPGTRLRNWLSRISERSCRRIFDPIIADMQHEWLEAHKAGKLARARWVHFLCAYHLLAAVFAKIPFSAVRWLWEAWKKTTLG